MKPEEIVISVSAVPGGLKFSSHTLSGEGSRVNKVGRFGVCGSFKP